MPRRRKRCSSTAELFDGPSSFMARSQEALDDIIRTMLGEYARQKGGLGLRECCEANAVVTGRKISCPSMLAIEERAKQKLGLVVDKEEW